MKSGSPSRTTDAHKTQTKNSRPGPLSSSTVVTPPFIPSEAPPWDSRPVSGAGVVHYHSLHRPRSVPTALGPAPLSHTPHRPSQPGGTPETALYSPPPPLSGGSPSGQPRRTWGVRTDEARERRRKDAEDVTEKRVGERRKKKKKKFSVRFPDTPAARSSNQLSGSSWCHAMVLDLFGGRPDAPPPPGGRWWLLRSRAAGSESPVPCSSTNLADGSRLRPTGERRRLLRSLSDGSHPSSSQEHGSESSVPPVLLLLQHHRFGQPLAVSATSCCPISSAPAIPLSSEGSLTACPSFIPGFGTNVTQLIYTGRRRLEPANI